MKYFLCFWILFLMLSCIQNPNNLNSATTEQSSETQLEIVKISEAFVEIEALELNKVYVSP